MKLKTLSVMYTCLFLEIGSDVTIDRWFKKFVTFYWLNNQMVNMFVFAKSLIFFILNRNQFYLLILTRLSIFNRCHQNDIFMKINIFKNVIRFANQLINFSQTCVQRPHSRRVIRHLIIVMCLLNRSNVKQTAPVKTFCITCTCDLY